MTRSIHQIDQAIDANRRFLQSRRTLRMITFLDWGHAWAANPDLYEREQSLFRERGAAQQERDTKANKEWQAQQRRQRAAYRRKAA